MNLEQQISNKLTRYEIRPSLARTQIYKYLIEKRNHPSVETIYLALQNQLSTISKTTVYNTLKLFVDKRIVNTLGIEDNELRFDADVSSHGHFKCVKCNGIFDFELELDSIQTSGLKGFELQDYHLYIKGTCRLCKAS